MNRDELISKISGALMTQDTLRPYAWYVTEAMQGKIPYSADFCYWRDMAEAVCKLLDAEKV